MARKKKEEPTKTRAANPNVMGLKASVVDQEITETLETNYMPYAMSVIVSRAIPEIDGFKPAHRKLLYTMYKMGLLTGNRTKSANIVGQTMKLNPHGDAAIYDTMVRLSRGHGALLHPFVDSKGNFGKHFSRDMAWAAPRYTEAKLEAICQELMRDLDQDAVDFVDNYDNTMKEPKLLPTTFPNILVSANMGIAVGMASNFCGFNLAEVCDTTIAYLKNPKCDLSETLLAPDFPTGGEIIFEPQVISDVYNTGRGSIKIRGRYRYLKKENIIEIYEIPYSTTTEAIMDKVAELIKNGKLKEISDMRDETDLSGLKLAIDLKRGTDPEKLMAKLFKMTPLQDSFGCNFNVLIDGVPKVLGVRDLLEEWCKWRIESVQRRVSFTASKKKEKLHLMEGLKRILLDIDKAIKIIRNTEQDADVIPNLMSGFQIDEVQAEYVSEIKLRNINKEYILKRVQEEDALRKEIADLEDLLSKPVRIKKVIIGELQNVKKKYGQRRLTTIVQEQDVEVVEEADAVPDYPVKVFLSRGGYFKKITPQSLRMADVQKYKEGDGPSQEFETMNRAEAMFFTNQQKVYKVKLSDFNDTKASAMGDYLPTKLGMNPDETVVYMVLPGDYSGYILFCFENGKIAKVPLQSYVTSSNRRRLTNAYSDKNPLSTIAYVATDAEVVLYSSEPRALIIDTAQLTPKASRTTQGVQVMILKPKFRLAKILLLSESAITNQRRYRYKAMPATGAVLKAEDGADPSLP